MSQLVVTAAYQQIHITVGEDILGLQQLAGVALVKEIIDTISIDTDSPGSLALLRHLLGDLDRVVHPLPLPHRQGVCAEGGRQHAPVL